MRGDKKRGEGRRGEDRGGQVDRFCCKTCDWIHLAVWSTKLHNYINVIYDVGTEADFISMSVC